MSKNKKSRVARLGKRKTFKSIFFKRWFAVLLVFAILLAIFVPVIINATFIAMENLFYVTNSNMQHSLEDAYADIYGKDSLVPEEDRDQAFIDRAKYRIISYAYSSEYLSMLYDSSTGEILADCDETLFILVREDEEKPAKMYSCPTSAVPEYRDLLASVAKDFKTYTKYYVEADFDTFYIKDDEFRPGPMTAYVAPLESEYDLTLQDIEDVAVETYHFDYTPTESGYTECNVNSYKTVLGPLVAGYGDTTFYLFRDSADKAWEILHETYNEETGLVTPKETDITISHEGDALLIVSETPIYFSADTVYTLRSVCYFDTDNILGLPFIIFIIAVILLSALFCFITAKITYARLKAQYDIEDYRKTLMNTMAHDLKSPLMSISGYAENLKESVHSEKREHYAAAIMNNVDHMNRIISDILSLSKTENGNVVLNKTELNVEEVIRDCLKKYELQLGERKLQTEIVGALNLRADQTLFTEAMDNLIGNAVKYADSDSLITFTLNKKSIGITNQCSAEIKDVNELLKPFVTGNENRSNKGGSGLGLAIAKNIMDLHKFDLYVKYENKKFEVIIKL